MLQKLIKFVKNNLAAVLGIAVIIVSCLLMLLPGQFANLYPFGDQNKNIFSLNGYQFIFNTITYNGKEYNHGTGVVGSGIALIVLFTLAIVSLILNKKSSALLMLGGLLNVTSAILFFSMEASAEKYYPNFVWGDGTDKVGVIQWVSYVNGALLLLAGAYIIYKAILVMKDEIKHPAASKSNTYNYLKK